MLILLVLTSILTGVVLFNTLRWPRVTASRSEETAVVSVLIPARNEAAHITACLQSVREQGPVVREALVYDDHSTDQTAALVQAAMRDDPRVRLIAAQALPAGWGGKTFGCQTLSEAATGEWLLFLDADARLRPQAVERMVAEVRHRRLTFLSCWPGLVMQSAWEKIFMPMLNFCVFTLFPAPLAVFMRWPSLGLAHGACIFLRRQEHQRIGGHARVKGEMFEDTLLARIWREENLAGLCLDGQDVVRVRMYASLAEIWRGFARIIYPAFRSDFTFWLFQLFHALVFLAPFAGLLAGWHRAAALAACGLILLMRVLQARRFGYPLWSVLCHPLAEAGLVLLGLFSWAQCRWGRGVPWRGRLYKWRRGNA